MSYCTGTKTSGTVISKEATNPVVENRGPKVGVATAGVISGSVANSKDVNAKKEVQKGD